MLIKNVLKKTTGKSLRDTVFHSYMNEWVLPHWYQRQNDPSQHGYVINGNHFYNFTSRRWTVFYFKNVTNQIYLDRQGVIYFSRLGISLEIWIHNGEGIYTPSRYREVHQKFNTTLQIIETYFNYSQGSCTMKLTPVIADSTDSIMIEAGLKGRTEDNLKQQGMYIIIRPFDNNGLSKIYRMEYKQNRVFVNGTPILLFEKEPKQCYFCNGQNNDITEFFISGKGNSSAVSKEGACNGLIAYLGLPAELDQVRFFVITEDKRLTKYIKLLAKQNKYFRHFLVKDEFNFNYPTIQTGNFLDQLLDANLKYLAVFCSTSIHEISVFQILTLNRFGGICRSRNYLDKCLKHIRWDGKSKLKLMGPDHILIAIADYYNFSGDLEFIKNNWTTIKKCSEGLWYQKDLLFLEGEAIWSNSIREEDYYNKYFWRCAALKALVELAQIAKAESEISINKERYFLLSSHLIRWISDIIKEYSRRTISSQLGNREGEFLVRILAAAYPLQLWERNYFLIRNLIQLMNRRHLYRGGVIAKDFQGIDLALTAGLGQILIREGYDYSRLLQFLTTTASETWSWPDRIHPITHDGVGVDGHDPSVMYQILLLIRCMFLLEEGDRLILLPGILNHKLWEYSRINIERCPSFFGELSFRCFSLGDIIQIEFKASYRKKPQKVILYYDQSFKLVYCDAKVKNGKNSIEITPDFHKIRLKRIQYSGLS